MEVLYGVVSTAADAKAHAKVRFGLHASKEGVRVWPTAHPTTNVRYAIVIGDKAVDDPIGRLDGDLLRLNCGDGDEHRPEKMVVLAHAVRRLEAFNTVTHVVKVDDVHSRLSPLRLHRLGARIAGEPDEWDYRGHFRPGPTRPPHEPLPAPLGQTYVLSARALDVVVAAWPVVDDPAALARLRAARVREDFVIGEALEAGGIEAVEAHYGAMCVDDGAWAACAALRDAT